MNIMVADDIASLVYEPTCICTLVPKSINETAHQYSPYMHNYVHAYYMYTDDV